MKRTYPDFGLKEPVRSWEEQQEISSGMFRKMLFENFGCPKCGLKTHDPFGRPISMGYVCANSQCPIQPKVIA